MPSPLPPSGQQLEIRHGDQHAVVTESGATLREYGVGARPVLDGFGIDQVCSGARGQHLIPWPNRIRGGRYEYGGKRQQLALSEPLNGNAIHGLTRWASWIPTTVEADRVVLSHTLHAQPGWPGSLSLTIEIGLGEGGLTVTTTARNVGSTDVPYGVGSHPYLTVGGATVDGALLTLPAARYARPDDRGIPVDLQPVDGSDFDFRTARPIGDLVLDTAYTDLTRDADGLVRVRLADAETGSAATVWADETHTWLQVFTGDTLGGGKARAGLAIEPMTCGPDAFNTGDSLLTLAPGDEHRGTWGITPGLGPSTV